MPNRETKERRIVFMEKLGEDRGSSTICSAKWLQSTINLYNGTTHSCHFCPRHSIDPSELDENPLAIHNTERKKEDRKKMLSGERPSDCDSCWVAEDTTGFSDRFVKTEDPTWSRPHLDQLDNDNPLPSYVEIAFDNVCNMRCLYCTPSVSSRWYEEIGSNGPFNDLYKYHSLSSVIYTKSLPIRKHDYNPYVEAFEKLWPELHKSLKVFRITGGEPLMTPHTWKYLDYIEEVDSSHLYLSINSNLSTRQGLIDRLIERLPSLESKVSKLEIVTSCEAYGEQAEYIRDGLEYDRFIENCWSVLRGSEKTHLTVTLTNNVLSIMSLDRFLVDMYKLREVFGERIYLSISILHQPGFLNIKLMSDTSRKIYISKARKVIQEKGNFRELSMLERLEAYGNTDITEPEINKEDLLNFLNDWDRRRGTDYKVIFPHFDKLLR